MNLVWLKLAGAAILVIAIAYGYHVFADSLRLEGAKSQKQIDDNALAIQKQSAAAELAVATKEATQRKLDADAATHKLEIEHADNQANTERLHTALASVKLRFAAEPGCGTCSADSKADSGAPASNASSATCIVSDKVSADLKSIVYDADKLRDDYKLLYDWARTVSCY